MGPRVLQFGDVENAHDRPERVGRLAGAIDRLRGDDAVVVGSGDDTAPGALAVETGGRHALAFFERVRPDAETFGNHEFDHGLRALRELVEESPVPWVSANLRRDGDPFAGVAPARAVEAAGDRVAVVGVTDPDLTLPPTLAVADPVESVRRVAGERDADYLVVLAHTSDDTARALARETPVDAVLAGHRHEVVRDRVDGTLLVRPGANGRVVWEIHLGSDGDPATESAGGSGGVTATATRHDVPEGPIDDEMAERAREQIRDAGLDEVVAAVDTPIQRDVRACLRGECRLVNLATDALRRVADADVAHVDTRGLRDGPPLGPEVTRGDLIGTAPFAAGVFVATVTGRELRRLVAESRRTDLADGAVWTGQFSGVELERDGEETRVFVRDGDGRRRLDPEGSYRLATNGYVVYAGEFETVGPGDVRELHGLQYEAFVAYARSVDDLTVELDGRIRHVDGTRDS